MTTRAARRRRACARLVGVAPARRLAPRIPATSADVRADCAFIEGAGAGVGGWGAFEPARRRPMPRAYSSDLRERALAAWEAGEGRQSEIARAYRIGERTLSGWLKTAREEGRRAPRPRRGGTKPVGGE